MEENEVFTWDVPLKHSPTQIANEEVIYLDNMLITPYGNSSEIHDNDQMAAENLVYLSQEPVSYMESAELADDPNVECVTEEVITDDWVLPGGMERVEVPLEQLTAPDSESKEVNDLDIPVPTDQDEYTAMRPWPCDFCSRRFRKKVALMNHMVAHQNDRPHSCNLCGVSYVRKCDLMNHLKVHAFVPDGSDGIGFEEMLDRSPVTKPKKKRGRRKKIPVPKPVPEPEEEDDSWENMTSARTQQWSRRARTPPRPPSPPSVHSPSPPPSPPPVPTDPSRPFVCKHCGVGFAREKALQSHSRIHGGDSPIECRECGELCWSREALSSHARHKHPHLPAPRADPPDYSDSDSDNDQDYQVSPRMSSSERMISMDVRGPELFCQECGVAFQRADLLRRHVAAAHSYKRHDSASWTEHACDVCGERCQDALQLLAHAELHADRQPAPRLKKSSRSRINTTTLPSGLKQFPCKECGKVFGSRSSQQIHVRIHTGERPYACRFCWKAFADGGTLRKHERIHTGEKPYACAVCPRAFNQRVVLREHVRSHHSLPERRANGNTSYICAVCARALSSSAELVAHLIQHCDANTALKRRLPTGPRKYKRRRKVKPAPRSWDSPSPRATPSPSPQPPSPLPTPSPRAASPRRRRKRRVPPPRPKMIHTEPKGKVVVKQQPLRTRRPPRHPADDLRAIQPHHRTPSPPSPQPPTPSPPPTVKTEPVQQPSPYKCEMCSEQFARRDDLLLHVPIHI